MLNTNKIPLKIPVFFLKIAEFRTRNSLTVNQSILKVAPVDSSLKFSQERRLSGEGVKLIKGKGLISYAV